MPWNRLTGLLTPNAMPDVTSDEYQVTRRALEDHPATAGIPPKDLSSLEQYLADVITEDLHNEIDQLRDELNDAQEDLKAANKELRSLRRELGKARRGATTRPGGVV
ncbi:hypothetical protein [Frankia sp. Cj5]|uniref:hypothetical protein n=1 Tax=Frankia sp. Cj5 TaxID=2880978 RepID=UPI001EF70B28|nr:hypothetical protein [Frankia sp. Cj5]